MLLLNQIWFKCESKDRLFYHSPTYIRPVVYIYLTITGCERENVLELHAFNIHKTVHPDERIPKNTLYHTVQDSIMGYKSAKLMTKCLMSILLHSKYISLLSRLSLLPLVNNFVSNLLRFCSRVVKTVLA